MKKRIIPLFLAVLLILCSSALGDQLVSGDRYLSSREIADLTQQSGEIYDTYGLRVMLQITYDTAGYSRTYDGLRNCANDIFNRSCYGEDGLIFLVRMADRYCVTVSKGKGEEIFSRQILDEVEEDVLHYLSEGDYYGAFSAYLNDISSLMARYEKGERFYGSNTASLMTPAERVREYLPLILGFSALITVIVMLIIRSRMKTAQRKATASDYIAQSALTRKQDLYLYTTTTRTRIQSGSGSGSRGGSGHFGGSHGGGSSSGHHF